LSQVEVDEMFGLMSDITAEVATMDAMPGWVVLFVKLLLDICGDVLLDVIFVQCLQRRVHRVVLHLFRHVRILHHCFFISARHLSN